MRQQNLFYLLLGIFFIVEPLKASDKECFPIPFFPLTNKVEDRMVVGCYAACRDYLIDCRNACTAVSHRFQGGCGSCSTDFTACVKSCFAPRKSEYVIKDPYSKHRVAVSHLRRGGKEKAGKDDFRGITP